MEIYLGKLCKAMLTVLVKQTVVDGRAGRGFKAGGGMGWETNGAFHVDRHVTAGY